jgi:hypothetical protein
MHACLKSTIESILVQIMPDVLLSRNCYIQKYWSGHTSIRDLWPIGNAVVHIIICGMLALVIYSRLICIVYLQRVAALCFCQAFVGLAIIGIDGLFKCHALQGIGL